MTWRPKLRNGETLTDWRHRIQMRRWDTFCDLWRTLSIHLQCEAAASEDG